jgi:hypothetical protein
LLSAALSAAAFDLADHLAAAEALIHPVRLDPTASSWDVPVERGEFEGAVLARGDGWAVLKMVLLSNVRDIEATVDTFSDHMLFDFETEQLDVRPNLVRLGELVLGCAQDGLTAFMIGPGYVDGKLELAVPTCWPTGEAPPAPEQTTTSSVTAEFRSSFDLQCRQLIQAVETE